MADDDPKALEIVYGGTINAEPAAGVSIPIKEFYRLPLKQKNEIVVQVKASSDADILLFDGDKSSSSSNVKVQILLGTDKNTNASIGLAKDDGSGGHAKEIVEKRKLLSATHPKVFTIRWYYGRVMVYNHGYKKPFITWDGPKDGAFSHIGVRTNGCSGEWQVQNEPIFNTADGAEYKEIEINSGRLDFEVDAWQNAWVHFLAEAKFINVPSVQAVIGTGANPTLSGFWVNMVPAHTTTESTWPVIPGEYRRFYVKWDANNMVLGRPGPDRPIIARRWQTPTPVKPIRYIGLQGYNVQQNCYFHILNLTREEDTAERKVGEQDAGEEVEGVLVYNYESVVATAGTG